MRISIDIDGIYKLNEKGEYCKFLLPIPFPFWFYSLLMRIRARILYG